MTELPIRLATHTCVPSEEIPDGRASPDQVITCTTAPVAAVSSETEGLNWPATHTWVPSEATTNGWSKCGPRRAPMAVPPVPPESARAPPGEAADRWVCAA